jgi:hypothetical protein
MDPRYGQCLLDTFRGTLYQWIAERVNKFSTQQATPEPSVNPTGWSPIEFRLVRASYDAGVLTFTYTDNRPLITVNMNEIPCFSASLDIMFAQYVIAKMEQIMSVRSAVEVHEHAIKAQRHIDRKVVAIKRVYSQPI